MQTTEESAWYEANARVRSYQGPIPSPEWDALLADAARAKAQWEGKRGRLDIVAAERWHELKAAEKLIRQLEEALKGLLYVVKSDPNDVPKHLQKDVRRAETALEIVASRKRERRARP